LVYRVYPRDIPDSVWNVAKRQRSLWNDLVSLWHGAFEQTRALSGQKAAIWNEFEKWCRAAMVRSELDWVNGPDVLERFKTTTRSKKIPHHHAGLDRIAIAHRFTNGGIPLEKIINNRRVQRLTLLSSDNWELPRKTHSPGRKHWRAHIRIGAEIIDSAMALHRPLPKHAILKRAAWLGRRARSKWFWYLALTVEEDPLQAETICDRENGPSAGLDLGWRVFANGSKRDYLRIGMVADTEGRTIELRLPLWLRPLREQERCGFPAITKLTAEASALINQAIDLVQELTQSSESICTEVGARIGYRSLTKILASMPYDDSTTAAIRELLNRHDRLHDAISKVRFRLIQRRRWYYHNLAQWICSRYRAVAVNDLSLAHLHQHDNYFVSQNAAKYRNYAAVGELRNYLRRAAVRYGCQIVEITYAATTRTCYECGAKIERSASLTLRCPNGHEFDQDKNASRNLCAIIGGTFEQAHAFPKLEASTPWKKLDLPAAICAMAIEVPVTRL